MFKGSWKTSAAGFLGGLAILAHQLSYLLDSDPATTFSLDAVFAALSVMGVGYFSRDNNKSSEDVGVA